MRIKPNELLRAKITILYVLDNFATPISSDQFSEFMVEQQFLNYFDLQEFIAELVQAGHIKVIGRQNVEFLLITEEGRNSLDLCKSEIAAPLRHIISDAVAEKAEEIKVSTNIYADYKKLGEHEYQLQIGMNEGSTNLIDINANVLTNKDAKTICDNWRRNARFMYGDLLRFLSGAGADEE